jgi:uncharacterized iron-regulated membrane protein
MLKPWVRRLHLWVALGFALPLIAVIGSGAFLALEPAAKALTPPGTVTLERLQAILDAAGPEGERGALFIRGYDGTATLGGRNGPGGAKVFDLATAQVIEPGPLASAFRTTRRFHETLLLDLGWVVEWSTIALLLLLPLGLLLGWPRLRHTVLGWHRLAGWALLPLLVGSPLTGLFLAYGISFATPTPRLPGTPPPLAETLRLVAERHDLNGLDWVRPAGGARNVRVLDASGTATVYRASATGLEPLPRNWPRLLHEGNWAGVLGSLANLVAALAMLGLLGTGIYLWARRQVMRRKARASRGAAPRPRQEPQVLASPTS